MPFTLYMPKLSPTMEAGTLVKWHKKEGDQVEADELLFEVATDKATVEYNAIDSGWIAKILVKEGQDATVNQPVAIMTEQKGESFKEYTPEVIGQTSTQEKSESIPKQTPEPKIIPQENKERILVSPLAKRIATEQGVDLSSVKGSGPSGRIMSRDLTNVTKHGNKKIPNISPGSFTEEALTPIRKVISQRLQESKSTIPHFYVEQSIDAESLVLFREQLKALGMSISFNDCVVKACAMALKQHPVVNCGFNAKNNTIIHFQTIDVAVAVSIEAGLITPIVRFTDYKDLATISNEIKELAKKAKAGKLALDEFQGGSFTVSNLGMYGTTNFQAIINPPQAAILAVGAILDAPVVKNGQVVSGKIMQVTLSVDHRVVDGVAAAEFLRTVKTFLENPLSLVI